MTDQTQGNWNGITGRMELRTARPPHIRVLSDIASCRVSLLIDGECHQFALGDSMRLWSEFDPYLYTRTIRHHGVKLRRGQVGGGWALDDGSEFHVKGGARGLDWNKQAPQCHDDFCPRMDFPRNYQGTTPNHAPIIAHELGQWCAFPALGETTQ